MPIKAMVTVYECDACRTVESVDMCKTEEYLDFEDNWTIGAICSFCPQCKNSGFAKAKIAGEKAAFEKVKNTIVEGITNVSGH